MQDLKHFAELLIRVTKGRLDKVNNKPTLMLIRSKMRRFYNAWERKNNIDIAARNKLSMAPVSILKI